ncbi:MAG: amidohydrolase family protein [Betaproteobacteria bacterium]
MDAKPSLTAPAGACDCHMHIYDPRYRAAPTWPMALPDAPVAAYREVQRELGTSRVVVVQPNGYMFDNACTEEALRQFGDTARGVATIRPDVTDAEIARLTQAGFRGARCFMLKGGFLSWDDVERIAQRVKASGWHVQLQLDGRDLPQLAERITGLAGDVVIDHNGKFLEPVPPTHASFGALLRLLESGKVWVKLSAPYETSKTGAPAYEDVSALARALVGARPDRCVWASNWPHPGANPIPSSTAMLDLLLDWAPDPRTRQAILVDNPARLYTF